MNLPSDQRVWVVDTFCEDGYLGNPAAVVEFDAGFPGKDAMQSASASLAFPTTAFMVAIRTDLYRIRWFTPEQELNLCGHASIAAAAVVYERVGRDSGHRLQFETPFGPLYTEPVGKTGIALDLPGIDVSDGRPPPGLEAALGTEIVACAHSVDDLVIELVSEAAVARLEPDFSALKSVPCRGHVVTAVSAADDVDFVSRAFFPALGVNEDQVCVSAHCKLAPYWGRRFDKRSMTAIQLSERGGLLGLFLREDRVHVAGAVRLRRASTFGDEIALGHQGLYRP